MPQPKKSIDQFHEAKSQPKKPKSKGKRLSRTTIEHADNGGHMVEHHYEETGEDKYLYHKPEKVALTDNAALNEHMASKFPGKSDNDGDD